ncbi:hypothetical protein FHL15_008572 [Xylaria flabelliformis]|uniref:Heterokaryon incompatibility domain-containing protein n=1 Tax=Xylaria flabelliformis TaxID=2512241 RepID=A0A553HRL7_9PEZI|nr:hypothetical protein FHL15_008572 [Xylaria flabelliformis]
MGNLSIASTLVGGAVLLAKLSNADRACSSNVSPSYLWRVSDARFDGASPNVSNGKAVVAVSKSWAGFVDGNIIWSDCIWSGAGPTLDRAVAFAVDWKNRTMYLSHTFSCSDKNGSDSMATGSFNLDLDCKNDDDGSTHCTLKSATTTPALQAKTVPGAPRLAANATCEDNAKVYQSWQLENWHRQYKLTPGDPASPPQNDSGPSFSLHNLANGGVFECVPGKKTEENVFDGTCTQAAGANVAANTEATFRFDPVLDMLFVTQNWTCGADSSFDASGVGTTATDTNTEVTRAIFADQICINRADDPGKIQQVRLLGEMYTRSARTIVWLGIETRETRPFFEVSSKINSEVISSTAMGPNQAYCYMNVFDAVLDSSIELQTKAEKEDRTDILELVAHHGPIFPMRGADQHQHGVYRRILAPGFTNQTMVEQELLFREFGDKLIQRLQDACQSSSAVVDVSSWYNWATFDVIGSLAFGESAFTAQALHFGRFLAPILMKLFLPRKLAGKAHYHNKLSAKKVRKRLATDTTTPDYISAMKAGKGKDQGLPLDELVSYASVLTMAVSETSATTLSATYDLAMYPEILTKVQSEIRGTFADEGEIGLDSRKPLPYLQAIIEETLRVFPPAPLPSARVIGKTGETIAQTHIPAGTYVESPIWVMNHHTELFVRPFEFLPERWFPANETFESDRLDAVMPFGYGPRVCIGKN